MFYRLLSPIQEGTIKNERQLFAYHSKPRYPENNPLSLFNLLVQNPKEKTSALIAQAISLSCTIYGHKKVQNWLWKNGSFCFQGWMRFHRETRSTLRGTTPLLRSLSTASSSLAEWTVVNAAFYHRQARIFTKSPLSSTPAFCALSWQKGRLPTEGASHPVLN